MAAATMKASEARSPPTPGSCAALAQLVGDRTPLPIGMRLEAVAAPAGDEAGLVNFRAVTR